MDLWVVKYASRRSRIGDFSGDSSVRGARIRGVLASHANAGQRELSAHCGSLLTAQGYQLTKHLSNTLAYLP